MSEPVLLGECTLCSRKVYRRDDCPESPEWFRPAAKGPLRPHTHDQRRIGQCSLCSATVLRGGDGVEKVRRDRKLVPHRHVKPFEIKGDGGYRLVPVREEVPDSGPLRGWEIYADRMGAL